jgi:hypothetical protein
VSRALERQVDDAAPYMTKAPRASATVAATAATVFPSPATASRPATVTTADSRAPVGIEISLEDTPVVDLVPAMSSAFAPAAPAVSPARAGRLTMSLKPLSPELSETILPASIAKSPRPKPQERAPVGGRAGVLDLPLIIGEEPPVDLAFSFGPEDTAPTDPSLARPTPSPPDKPRR